MLIDMIQCGSSICEAIIHWFLILLELDVAKGSAEEGFCNTGHGQ